MNLSFRFIIGCVFDAPRPRMNLERWAMLGEPAGGKPYRLGLSKPMVSHLALPLG